MGTTASYRGLVCVMSILYDAGACVQSKSTGKSAEVVLPTVGLSDDNVGLLTVQKTGTVRWENIDITVASTRQ